MIEIETTDIFIKWYNNIKDVKTFRKIQARFDMIRDFEHFGDTKPIRNGIYELRFHIKSGIRIYYKRTDNKIILLLNGGTKGTQKKDIEKAKKILKELK
jgi:putative addiction module killer protein